MVDNTLFLQVGDPGFTVELELSESDPVLGRVEDLGWLSSIF